MTSIEHPVFEQISVLIWIYKFNYYSCKLTSKSSNYVVKSEEHFYHVIVRFYGSSNLYWILSTDCDAGTYGANCILGCGSCSGGDPCSRIDGDCASGCEFGYKGDTCQGRN